jgi:hypothetical protein
MNEGGRPALPGEIAANPAGGSVMHPVTRAECFAPIAATHLIRFMPFPVTEREKWILAVIAALIVLGLIGMAVL